MICYAEIEFIFYDGHSLKEKRSILKRMFARLKKDFNVAVTELDYHDLWQRAKIGVVTLSTERVHSEKVIQQVLMVIDSFTEIERNQTDIEFL